MRIIAAFLITAGLAFSASSQEQSAAPGGSSRLSLDEAVAAAFSGGDDIVALQRTLDSARGQYLATAAKGKAALSGTLGYSAVDTEGDTTVKTSWSKNEGLYQTPTAGLAVTTPLMRTSATLSQSMPEESLDLPRTTSVLLALSGTLWDGYPGGQAKAAADKGYLALQGKELSFSSGKSAIAAKVKQAYAAMLGAQRALDLKMDQTRKQKTLLDQVTAIHTMRQASEIDLETAQINADTAVLDEESARKDLTDARRRLAVLIGRPTDLDFLVDDIPDPKLPAETVESAIATGLSKRTDLSQLRLNRRSSEIDLTLSKGSAQPAVSFSGAMNFAYAWDDPARKIQTYSAGVSISLPVLDSGAAKGSIDSVSALISSYDAQERILVAGIESDIRNAYWAASIQSRPGSPWRTPRRL